MTIMMINLTVLILTNNDICDAYNKNDDFNYKWRYCMLNYISWLNDDGNGHDESDNDDDDAG